MAAALFLHRGGSQPHRQRGTDTSRLTSLVCGDVDRDMLWGKGTLAGDPIDSLDVKGIMGAWAHRLLDGDATRSGPAAWARTPRCRHSGSSPAVCPALLTDDVVGHVIPPHPSPRGVVPLQNDGCLIDEMEMTLRGPDGTPVGDKERPSEAGWKLGQLSIPLWCDPTLSHTHTSLCSPQLQTTMSRSFLRKKDRRR